MGRDLFGIVSQGGATNQGLDPANRANTIVGTINNAPATRWTCAGRQSLNAADHRARACPRSFDIRNGLLVPVPGRKFRLVDYSTGPANWPASKKSEIFGKLPATGTA
jgi:hypothetical protein